MSFAICETKPRLAEGKNDLKEVALAPDDCCKTIERLRYLKNEKKSNAKYHRQVKNYADYLRVKEHQLKDILNDYRRNTDLDSSREIERSRESLKNE